MAHRRRLASGIDRDHYRIAVVEVAWAAEPAEHQLVGLAPGGAAEALDEARAAIQLSAAAARLTFALHASGVEPIARSKPRGGQSARPGGA